MVVVLGRGRGPSCFQTGLCRTHKRHCVYTHEEQRHVPPKPPGRLASSTAQESYEYIRRCGTPRPGTVTSQSSPSPKISALPAHVSCPHSTVCPHHTAFLSGTVPADCPQRRTHSAPTSAGLSSTALPTQERRVTASARAVKLVLVPGSWRVKGERPRVFRTSRNRMNEEGPSHTRCRSWSPIANPPPLPVHPHPRTPHPHVPACSSSPDAFPTPSRHDEGRLTKTLVRRPHLKPRCSSAARTRAAPSPHPRMPSPQPAATTQGSLPAHQGPRASPHLRIHPIRSRSQSSVRSPSSTNDKGSARRVGVGAGLGRECRMGGSAGSADCGHRTVVRW